jgi:hypothetical protein
MLYRYRFARVMTQALLSEKKHIDEEFVVGFRLVPLTDTDVTRAFTHTFSMLMALARFHIVFSSELRTVAVRRKWIPFSAAETIAYWKPLRSLEQVSVRTSLACWDERRFYLSHSLDVRGNTRAVGYAQALIRGPQGILHPGDVFREAGLDVESPAFPEPILSWAQSLASDRSHRTTEGA